MEIGHEIISTAILSLLLIQVEQLLATGQVQVNRLCLSLPRKSVVRLTDHLNMTIVVDWDVKPQNKLINNSFKHNLAPNKCLL